MRKRTVFITGLLALILGLLLGAVLSQEYFPWGTESSMRQSGAIQSAVLFSDKSGSGSDGAPDQSQGEEELPPLNPKENFPLLNVACAAVRLIQRRDYAGLSVLVHPERGLTLTPYSTVNTTDDLTFTAAQVANFGQDSSRYTWGLVAGTGELIQMTPEEFFSAYLFQVDYTQASRIGLDQINISGNALENVTEAYPGCRFVDFTCSGQAVAAQGQDWSALKLVFVPHQDQWMLVGLIHSQWTE